ncbi:MAG: ABC transporter ATP-binding protein/permease [Rikenellaceae bacterium]|jgi:subfamily B ATP-binding cassette protein MsbA|nr:ABC transporter ATP-binding protein/permease [Rikenellaceae bacterium]
MKTYWRLLGFAKPIEKYAIPYFFYTLFYALFNTFSFVMIIPIVQTLFGQDGGVTIVKTMPKVEMSGEFLENFLNYLIYRIFGESYNVMDVLLFLSLFIVTLYFFNSLFRYLGQRTIEYMRISTMQRLRTDVFDNVLSLNVGYFSNERKGDIISKISSDVQVVQYCITNTLQVAFRDPFLILGYMIALVAISWELTIFAGLFLPLVAWLIGSIVKRLRKSALEAQENFGQMVSLLDESLTGVKVIKAYNATGFISRQFHRINALLADIHRSMARRQQLASPASEFLGITALVILLVYGGSLVVKGSLSASAFIAYLAMFSQITRPLRSFTDAFANINQGIAAGGRVMSLLDTKSTIVERENPVVLKEFADRIEFRDVRFSYEDREILGGVSFTINKGETVALVGPSGGGKSTISDLIPRFYDPQAGQILVDGVDLRDYSIDSLRSQIGVVSQETILFNDTIENNIRFGQTEPSLSEVENAARIANAHDFIMETEGGYQTNIGDRGVKLSGGQRQRLSIARAVLKNPPILILDEATSALDTESEKVVQEALDSLLEGRTSLVIAHRLSTIHNADKIIVVDSGQIAESGTHEQLMAIGGIYSKLVKMQQREKK